MNCYRCGTEGPDEKRFCADCGASLNRDVVVEATIRQQIDAALGERFKDQKFVASDIAEAIANRLLGWAKIYASIIGPLLTLVALLLVGFGFKNYQDVSSAADKAKGEIRNSLDGAVKDIRVASDDAEQRLAKSTEQISALESKVGEARHLAESVSKYEQTAGDVRVRLNRIQGELTDVERIRSQVTTLASRLQLVESTICPPNEHVLLRLQALGYLPGGIVSPDTARAALMSFQKDHHLVADGCAGARTERELEIAPEPR